MHSTLSRPLPEQAPRPRTRAYSLACCSWSGGVWRSASSAAWIEAARCSGRWVWGASACSRERLRDDRRRCGGGGGGRGGGRGCGRRRGRWRLARGRGLWRGRVGDRRLGGGRLGGDRPLGRPLGAGALGGGRFGDRLRRGRLLLRA